MNDRPIDNFLFIFAAVFWNVFYGCCVCVLECSERICRTTLNIVRQPFVFCLFICVSDFFFCCLCGGSTKIKQKNGKEEKLYWTTKFGTNLWNESLIDQRAEQKKTPLKKYPTHQLVICFKANGWLMCSTLEKWSTVQQLTIANGICLLCQKIYSQRQAAHNTTHKKITLTYEK